MNQSPNAIYNKILGLEREIEQLKVAAFFRLPKSQVRGKYPMTEILKTVKQTRNKLWEERYAGKI